MSHANGQVIYKDKVIGHFEYNGTCDNAISHIYDTYKEMNENWRKSEWLECKCGEAPLPVLLWTDYGNGFYWEGKACMNCRAILTIYPHYEYLDEDPEDNYSNCGFSDPRRWISVWSTDGYPLDTEPYIKEDFGG